MWSKTYSLLQQFRKAEGLGIGLATQAVRNRVEELLELDCGCEKTFANWEQVNDHLDLPESKLFNYRTAQAILSLSKANVSKLSQSTRDSEEEKKEGSPDSAETLKDPYNEVFRRSPNQSGRIYPKAIVLHDSMGSIEGTISWILQRRSRVSYHMVIRPTGNRVQLVWDKKKAWHSGKSSWTLGGKMRHGLNSHTLSAALSGDTRFPHTGKRRKANRDEINSLAWLCIYWLDKFPSIEAIVRHEDISPGRKTDTSLDVEKRVKAQILRHRPDLKNRL